MKNNRIISALLCAALAVCLLASCGSSSSSSSSSETPENKSEASASGILPSDDENSAFTFTDPAAAFESALGWGPGTAGTSLKSLVAAADMLSWAETNKLADNSVAGAAETLLKKWYNKLSDTDKDNFAEAWPLIKQDAEKLLSNKKDVASLAEDAGLDVDELPGCTQENWDALSGILDKIVPSAAQ